MSIVFHILIDFNILINNEYPTTTLNIDSKVGILFITTTSKSQLSTPTLKLIIVPLTLNPPATRHYTDYSHGQAYGFSPRIYKTSAII